MSVYRDRLEALRKAMKKSIGCDGFIIPHVDRWFSENLSESDNRLEWICGLQASAGYVVVTADKAAVLIDGRYALKAEQQVDQTIFDIGHYTAITPEDWLIHHLPVGSVIGYDPWLHTKREAKRMQKACNEAGFILYPVDENPVQIAWADRPPMPAQTSITHDLKYAGESVEQKLNHLREKLEADSLIITAADNLAWLLNMRVLTDPRQPGLRGYGIFEPHKKQMTVFTDVECSAFQSDQSGAYEIDCLPLDDLPMAIHHFEMKEQVIQISDEAPDWFTFHLNAPTCDIVEKPDPCDLMKACKNEAEQDHIRASHIRDARAVQAVIDHIKSSNTSMSEIEIADRLIQERSKDNQFQGVSFDSIVGWNANGAAIHGSPGKTVVEGDGLLLIDSGGQYPDGTTDITRTILIGTPARDMQEKYTLVLKAHIALATAIFPEGTTGVQLDALVRAPLWASGIDFAHGTGHGVGFFLNVHEGPCGISPRAVKPVMEGMLLSNEPGYYREGEFGIRLENLMLVQCCKQADDPGNETGKKLLCFETVTKVAFEDALILQDMLSAAEKNWLAAYQAECHALKNA